jgi:hypothetical protein
MTNQPPVPPSAAPPVKKFGVHWVAALPVLGLVVAVGGLMREIGKSGPYPDSSEHRAMGQAFGTLLWGIFIAFCVARLAWHVTGRSRFSSTLAFIAVILLFTRTTTQKLNAMTGPRTAAAQTEPLGGTHGAPQEASLPSAAPSPEAALNAARDRAAGRLFENQEKAKALINRWLDAGGADLGRPDSTEALERRLAMLDEMIAACRQLDAAADLTVATYGRELGAAGLAQHEREKRVGDIGAAAELEANRRELDACQRVMVADQELLGFLRAQWGRWTLEPETGECRFEDEAGGEHYERLAADAKFARRELDKLIQRHQHPDAAGD